MSIGKTWILQHLPQKWTGRSLSALKHCGESHDGRAWRWYRQNINCEPLILLHKKQTYKQVPSLSDWFNQLFNLSIWSHMVKYPEVILYPSWWSCLPQTYSLGLGHYAFVLTCLPVSHVLHISRKIVSLDFSDREVSLLGTLEVFDQPIMFRCNATCVQLK